MKVRLVNMHVPHSGHPYNEHRVVNELGDVCCEATQEGRRLILMMDANMDLGIRGVERMVTISAEGRRQMDRLKTRLLRHELIAHQDGNPAWKL